MNSFESDLKKYSEKTKLKAQERRELHERVLSYMEYHPLPKSMKNDLGVISYAEPYITISLRSMYARLAMGTFALLVLVGVPLAAERSVPGDALYMVKTGLNEGIQSKLADSPYEQVVFETKLIERRIAEARLLAQEGKLTEEVEAQIVETVKGHASAAQEGIAQLRTDDADEAAIAEIAFDSALEVQSAMLEGVASKEGDENSSQGIREVVELVREEVNANRSDVAPTFDGLMARVELETTRSYELFSAVKLSATSEEIADIERRLADIDRQIVGAREQNEVGAETAADELASALGLTQKLIAFMTNIDVRENVALETLVPVVLTLEEKTNNAQNELNAIYAQQIELEKRLELIEEPEVALKVETGLEQVGVLIADATTTLAAGLVDDVASRISEAAVLMADLDTLTIAYKKTEEIAPVTEENASSTPSVIEEVATSTPTEVVEESEAATEGVTPETPTVE